MYSLSRISYQGEALQGPGEGPAMGQPGCALAQPTVMPQPVAVGAPDGRPMRALLIAGRRGKG